MNNFTMSLLSFSNGNEDWKEFLTEDTKQALANVLETTKNHRGAFFRADDMKSAQLWCALVEMSKEISYLKSRLSFIEAPLQAIVSIGEAEKRKAIERIVSEIIKPIDIESQEATRKLVDSLRTF